MRALVIEDEALLAWMVEEILREFGITAVDWASSEAQAMAAAHLNSPDVLIADSDISSGNGVAAIRTICADRHIPTVIITGDPPNMRRSVPGAAIAEKPFIEEALADALGSILSEQATKSGCKSHLHPSSATL
jgi:DNA-binding response OmpR family regulator